MKAKLLIGIILALLQRDHAVAQYIWINVSYKAIVNPIDGQPAPYVTTHLVDEAIRFGNLMLDRYQRGYRLRLAEPLLWIGGSTHTNDPTRWYPFRYDAACDKPLEEQFRSDGYTNYPVMYAWNFSALNIFLTTFPCGHGGGFCATCSGRLSDYIINGTGQGTYGGFTPEENFAAHMIHEIGHYFGLQHTHGNSVCQTNSAGNCVTPARDDDGIADTIRDTANGNCVCFPSIDSLAQAEFGLPYSALSPQNRLAVSNVWYNVMSYHERFGYAIMTEGQLDSWTDVANSSRQHTASGRTRFVSTTGVNSGAGTSSTAPLRTVAFGQSIATASNDIVLLRPGHYNEQLTLSRPLTFRATRLGWATIGRP
jgi:hypothetical protein